MLQGQRGSLAYFGAHDRHSATPSDSECTTCSSRQTKSSFIQSSLLHSSPRSPQQYTHACARPVPARPCPCRRRAECTPHPHQCHSNPTYLTERPPLASTSAHRARTADTHQQPVLSLPPTSRLTLSFLHTSHFDFSSLSFLSYPFVRPLSRPYHEPTTTQPTPLTRIITTL